MTGRCFSGKPHRVAGYGWRVNPLDGLQVKVLGRLETVGYVALYDGCFRVSVAGKAESIRPQECAAFYCQVQVSGIRHRLVVNSGGYAEFSRVQVDRTVDNGYYRNFFVMPANWQWLGNITDPFPLTGTSIQMELRAIGVVSQYELLEKARSAGPADEMYVVPVDCGREVPSYGVGLQVTPRWRWSGRGRRYWCRTRSRSQGRFGNRRECWRLHITQLACLGSGLNVG